MHDPWNEAALIIGDDYFAIKDFAEEWTMTNLDMDKIAAALGAKRHGKASATAAYFGARQLLADIEARFRVPAGGGRPTDPRWTERRLVPLAPRTLERLEAIAAKVRERDGVNVEPMQLAALLLEKTTEKISEDEAKDLVRPRRRVSRRTRVPMHQSAVQSLRAHCHRHCHRGEPRARN